MAGTGGKTYISCLDFVFLQLSSNLAKPWLVSISGSGGGSTANFMVSCIK